MSLTTSPVSSAEFTNRSFTNIFAHNTESLVDLAVQHLFQASKHANFDIPLENIQNFVTEVAKHYYQNYYHSFSHGVDVMLNFYKFLSLTTIVIEPIEYFFLSIIALNHDVLHPGCSNKCLTTKNPMLPIIVNSISINEKVSVDMCKHLIKKTRLFKDISQENKQLFDEMNYALLIATDIETPVFGDIIENNIKMKSSVTNAVKDERKLTLLGVLLRISDVGNCLFSFNECVNWGYRLYLEISGKKLRRYELEENIVDAFKNQSSFLKGYITSLIVNAYKLGILPKTVYDDLSKNLVKLIDAYDKDFGSGNKNTNQIVNKYKRIIYWGFSIDK